MTDWSFPSDLQKRYDEIVAHTRKLQAELGIRSRTIEERYQDYLKRKEEEKHHQEDLAKYASIIGHRRAPFKFLKR